MILFRRSKASVSPLLLQCDKKDRKKKNALPSSRSSSSPERKKNKKSRRISSFLSSTKNIDDNYQEKNESMKLLMMVEQNKNRKKGVCFSDSSNDTILKITSISDMTKKEIQNTWYSQDEIHSMRSDFRNELKNDDIKLETQRKKHMNRAESFMSVFVEQEFQANQGYIDYDFIASAYEEISIICQYEAELRAIYDI